MAGSGSLGYERRSRNGPRAVRSRACLSPLLLPLSLLNLQRIYLFYWGKIYRP